MDTSKSHSCDPNTRNWEARLRQVISSSREPLPAKKALLVALDTYLYVQPHEWSGTEQREVAELQSAFPQYFGASSLAGGVDIGRTEVGLESLPAGTESVVSTRQSSVISFAQQHRKQTEESPSAARASGRVPNAADGSGGERHHQGQGPPQPAQPGAATGNTQQDSCRDKRRKQLEADMQRMEMAVTEKANRLRKVMHEAVDLEAEIEKESRALERITQEYLEVGGPRRS